uniref:Dual specificity phosphatase n=1 Tax=Marseillevirus LCMAC101 TaxID=2506602 RepID=A0A481YT24_9VIRU|nr:MAG: dual specificity phosphatase [Marseillevirus LCMAC101]
MLKGMYMEYCNTKEERRPKKPKSKKSRFERRKGPRYTTNGTSLSFSRPNIQISRTANRAEVNDMINYNEEDRTVTEVSYRKTFAPNIISRSPDGPNKGKTHIPSAGKSRRKIPRRTVYLENIYDWLYLGNLAAAECLGMQLSADYIINICDIDIPNARYGSKVINLYLTDNSRQDYQSFKRVMLQAKSILDLAVQEEKKVLVSCKAGINRSVSAIIVFSLLTGLYSDIDEVVEYIEQEKFKIYGNKWDTLTNQRFRDYIRQILVDETPIKEIV